MSNIGGLIYPVEHPGSTTPMRTGACTLQFQPSALLQSADSLVPHPVGLRLIVQGSIVQAANSPAISAADWDLLLSQALGPGFAEQVGVNLSSNGQQPVAASFASVRRIMASFSEEGIFPNGGIGSGPAIGASTPGQTVAVTLEYHVNFLTQRHFEPFSFVKPLAWWSTGSWNFTFSDPAVAMDSHLSWSATPTVTLEVDMFMAPNVIMGADFEWKELINPTTTSAALQLQAGIYQGLGLFSPAFGGASGIASDNLAAKVNALYITQMPLRYPLTPSSGLKYGFLQSSKGAFQGSPFSLYQNGQTPLLSTIQLAGPSRYVGNRESIHWGEVAFDQAITLSTTLASAFTANHSYYYARSMPRVACSASSLGGAIGDVTLAKIANNVPGCDGGFMPFQILIADGHAAPDVEKLPRSTLISIRR